MLTCNSKGRLFTFDKPCVMGILNVTPDSFYTRGRHNSLAEHMDKAGRMLEHKASILDIGGMSTRPGAEVITPAAEAERVIPVIEGIRKHYPEAWLSIDTYRAGVAIQAVAAGADIVNDISAGDMDENMLATVAGLNVPYIAMHMKGTPQTMQHNTQYEDVTEEVLQYFIRKIQACNTAGIKDVILDPGFGFGKNIAQNYTLLKNMHVLRMLNKPVLAGVSRKSMVYKLLGSDAEQALNGTTVLHLLALQQGAAILRVHDVKEAKECIDLFSYYQTI